MKNILDLVDNKLLNLEISRNEIDDLVHNPTFKELSYGEILLAFFGDKFFTSKNNRYIVLSLFSIKPNSPLGASCLM